MSTAFLLTTLVVVATPGTGAVYSVNAGLGRGSRAGLLAAFGCTVGVLPHMLAAVTGLAALLHRSAVAFTALQWLGVLYLLYLAWHTLRHPLTVDLDDDPSPRPTGHVIRTAVIINLLNPKLTVFFFAFLPQFVPVGEPHPTWSMLQLSAVFMFVTFVVFAGYGLFAAFMRDHVLRRPAVLDWMRRSFAAAYVVLACRLALE